MAILMRECNDPSVCGMFPMPDPIVPMAFAKRAGTQKTVVLF